MHYVVIGVGVVILWFFLRSVRKTAAGIDFDDFPYQPLVWWLTVPTEKAAAVVLLGNTPLTDALVEIFEKKKVNYWHIEDESQINQNASFRCLLALSDSDLCNLLVSRIGERNMNICIQYLLCNDVQNEPLFRQTGAVYWKANAPDAGEIYRMICARLGD